MARGLLSEGNILAYDPASNEVEWVSMWGMAEDLSQAEDTSAREISNMVPLDSANEAQRLDRFGEQRSESGGASDAEEFPTEAPHEECMDQGYEGDSDEERSDSTPDDSCSPASRQMTVRMMMERKKPSINFTGRGCSRVVHRRRPLHTHAK